MSNRLKAYGYPVEVTAESVTGGLPAPAALDEGTDAHPFRCRSRWQSLRCALQGVAEAWRSQPNLRIQGACALATIMAGCWFHLRLTEWLMVALASGLVIFSELLNTAVEQLVDLLVGLQPDPLARRIKDLAAGTVLVACLVALAVGVIVFGPYVLGRAR